MHVSKILLCGLVAVTAAISVTARSAAAVNVTTVNRGRHLMTRRDALSTCPTNKVSYNSVCYSYDCGLYGSNTPCECSYCNLVGGYCLTPWALSGGTQPYCFDRPYPQCIIDSNGLKGGSLTPIFNREPAHCKVLAGSVNLAFISYGNTVFASTIISQGFPAALFHTPRWAAPSSFTFSCPGGGVFPPILGTVVSVQLTGSRGTSFSMSNLGTAILSPALTSFPQLQSLDFSNTIFVIVVGPEVTVSSGTENSCTDWNGIHSTVSVNGGKAIIAVIPECSGAVSLQKSVLFHELTETVTDWANLFFDRDGSENADKCNFCYTDNVYIGSSSSTMQQTWFSASSPTGAGVGSCADSPPTQNSAANTCASLCSSKAPSVGSSALVGTWTGVFDTVTDDGTACTSPTADCPGIVAISLQASRNGPHRVDTISTTEMTQYQCSATPSPSPSQVPSPAPGQCVGASIAMLDSNTDVTALSTSTTMYCAYPYGSLWNCNTYGTSSACYQGFFNYPSYSALTSNAYIHLPFFQAAVSAAPGYLASVSLTFAQSSASTSHGSCSLQVDSGPRLSKNLSSNCENTCSLSGTGGTVSLAMAVAEAGDYGYGCLFTVAHTRCPGGSFCAGSSPAQPCPAGSYCPQGSSAPIGCPAGLYGTLLGMADGLSACTGVCQWGYYGNQTGLTSAVCNGPCSAGYYCYSASSSATQYICPAGSYCVAGSSGPVLCPAGTFGSTPGLTTAACSGGCLAGFFCPSGSTSQMQTPCPCCAANATSFVSSCPTLNLTSTIASGPVAPGGQYTAQFCCTGYATSSRYVYQAIVPSGYQASSIYLRYLSTEQGYDYCIVRSTAFIPAGYLLDVTTAVISALSGDEGAVGYGPAAGLWGTTVQFELYSDSSNVLYGCRWAFMVTACPLGYFCATGSQSPTICPRGSFCPSASVGPTSCPAGTFGATTGLASPACSGPCPCCAAGSSVASCSQTASPIPPATPSATPSTTNSGSKSTSPIPVPSSTSTASGTSGRSDAGPAGNATGGLTGGGSGSGPANSNGGNGGSPSSNIGVAVGGAVAGIVVLVVVGIIAFHYLVRRRPPRSAAVSANTAAVPQLNPLHGVDPVVVVRSPRTSFFSQVREKLETGGPVSTRRNSMRSQRPSVHKAPTQVKAESV